MRCFGVSYLQWVWGCALLQIVVSASFAPILPPAYPLAVRSPYLSSWLPGNQASSLPSSSPQFWFGNNLTWSVIARVDGQAYSLFGVSKKLEGIEAATVRDGNFTSTHSTFLLTAGSKNFTLDFFSPVSPTNYLRQSLPFSYLTISVNGVSSNDSVQIYSDIDSSWTGQPKNATWAFSETNSTSVFQLSPVEEALFSQNAQEQALWGETVYATRATNGSVLSSASGPLSAMRSQFVANGSLSNSYANWTSDGVVAFAHELGSSAKNSSITFAIGHVREQTIDYLGSTQTGYYRADYPNTASAVSHFLDDYLDALNESITMDKFIQKSGESSYGTNYSDILALSLRQIYGGMELTIPNDTLDTNDTMAFIKEISSDGNINTVDVIYASFPVFYVLNSDHIRLLLKPVFEYMAKTNYTYDFAVHDIGMDYPNATGHSPKGEFMPVEESGNILIMTYAYESATNRTNITSTYSPLLQKYAQYLNTYGKYPDAQLSLNDALGKIANQTNLAMKAASGLASYGHLTSQQNYTDAGKSIADALYNGRLGTDPNGTYFTIQYGSDSWFLAYNHYADVLFSLDLFPDEAYNATTAFYPTVRKPAGVALDANLDWGQTNWQGFVAATVTDEARDMFISDIHAYIANGLNDVPFSDRYWVNDSTTGEAGEYFAFRARPALGSHFALMALQGADQWGGLIA
ncbi:hypothetical protein CBS147343_2528 [Aspergillus niger]|nr:hypothetical protein CBS12448_10553 [Aspergillus niger]KAI2896668.1 hypothetical protein CBS11852_4271 [Aspergillus niger]KAI2933572.1 hypothetical protein CBS147320_1428 [Aspergillus niger]KAI2951010.1 hypothetical protein CBS147321_1279 [Aspergillus niger]KAI2953815.1 hypothetical protein CBS147322_3978 [Aspergillus niger]